MATSRRLGRPTRTRTNEKLFVSVTRGGPASDRGVASTQTRPSVADVDDVALQGERATADLDGPHEIDPGR